MKIIILSRNKTLYTTKRLYDSARANQHHVWVLDVVQGRHWLTFASKIARPGQFYLKFDALIPRIGIAATAKGLQAISKLETKQIVTTATGWGIAQSRDKWRSLLLLQSAGLPTPFTIAITHSSELQAALNTLGSFPVVIKIPQGTQGRGVFLAQNLKNAQLIVDILLKMPEKPILIQEYIVEAQRKDLRLFIVGNQCVAAMQRIAPNNDFRANVHRGASTLSFEPDEATSQLAIHAAQIHQLGVAGVDIIQSRHGPLILEVNSSPGLEGIEQATQVDIAAEIIHFVEQQYAILKANRQDRSGPIA